MLKKSRLLMFCLSILLLLSACTGPASTTISSPAITTSTTVTSSSSASMMTSVTPTTTTETTTVMPSPTTEPASTTPVRQTRIYKSSGLYYQISYPSSFRLKVEDDYNIFITDAINADNGIFIHVDTLTVDESAESYFNSIMEGRNEEITHLISEPGFEITENNAVIGYEFDCSKKVDDNKYTGKGIILKKGSFGFYVAFTSLEADWEEYQEIAVECLDSFTLPPIYTGSYTNSELGISLVLPANWSLIETGLKTVPVEIFSYSGDYVEMFSMPLMQSVKGTLNINSVEPGTTAEKYIDDKSDGATQTQFTFANSAVGSQYGMALNANEVTIAEFRYIALVVGSKVYYFEFIGVPDMSTPGDSVTELVASLIISSQ